MLLMCVDDDCRPNPEQNLVSEGDTEWLDCIERGGLSEHIKYHRDPPKSKVEALCSAVRLISPSNRNQSCSEPERLFWSRQLHSVIGIRSIVFCFTAMTNPGIC